MTSSSPFSSISCDVSSASYSSLLTSKLWSVRLLHLENLTVKVAGKCGVTEVCCWTIDHKHRKHGLRLPCNLQWASTGSSCEQTSWAKVRCSGAKVRCSGCKRLHVPSTCLTFLVFSFRMVFSVSADTGGRRHGPSPGWWCWLYAVESIPVCDKSSVLGETCYDPW